MHKYISTIIFTLLAFNCNASNESKNIKLIYQGYTFLIPENPILIAPTGDTENHTLLKYSKEKGKKYLSFSYLNEGNLPQTGCNTDVFFALVFNVKKSSECNQEEIHNFKKVFIAQHETGTWHGENSTAHYSISNTQSILFIFGTDGQAIKIDTDFMKKENLKEMLKEVL